VPEIDLFFMARGSGRDKTLPRTGAARSTQDRWGRRDHSTDSLVAVAGGTAVPMDRKFESRLSSLSETETSFMRAAAVSMPIRQSPSVRASPTQLICIFFFYICRGLQLARVGPPLVAIAVFAKQLIGFIYSYYIIWTYFGCNLLNTYIFFIFFC
jgi:hypothetical protein